MTAYAESKLDFLMMLVADFYYNYKTAWGKSITTAADFNPLPPYPSIDLKLNP